MSKVTVIVPTKDSARTLDACLSSIRAQTHAHVQLIVVDNFSSDDTQSIARRYADEVVVAGPERSAQRNDGARRAVGEYVAFIDSDMTLSPRVLEACAAAIEADRDVRGVVIPEESFGEGFWARCKALERRFYAGVPWMEAARFFRRDELLAEGGYDETLVSGEDWDLSQRMAKKGRLVRAAEAIRHDEGRLTLTGLLRKKRYYSTHFARYEEKEKNDAVRARQTSPFARYGLFLSRPRMLFAHPVVGIGMLFMKTCEFAAWAIARHTRR
jgi:glycosyltransferase involved in cell wall biosynthesis